MLLWQFQFTWRYAPYKELFYQYNTVKSSWHLVLADGTVQKFDRHYVLLECGLFFLLALTIEHQRKIIIIFFDQIADDAYRKLCILEKIY